jgi:hypothetical protein
LLRTTKNSERLDRLGYRDGHTRDR